MTLMAALNLKPSSRFATFFRWFDILVCRWFLSLVILALMVTSAWNLVDYGRSAGWIRLDGTIVALAISNYDGSTPDPAQVWPGGGTLSCRYSYTFQGKSYQGSRIGIETFDTGGNRSRRYRQLKERVDKAGGATAVLVNLAMPAESVLFRDKPYGWYFLLAFGLLWLSQFFFASRLSGRKAA
ncbi:MAG: DUF3592 domain-containing protein [Planctomycetes bacterium]|nr:DUF3592 domain-containing protein [Planctomycetota bacterium]